MKPLLIILLALFQSLFNTTKSFNFPEDFEECPLRVAIFCTAPISLFEGRALIFSIKVRGPSTWFAWKYPRKK